MKKSVDITSVESKAKLPEATVESYMNSRLSLARAKKGNDRTAPVLILNEYAPIDACSAYSPVYGTVEIVCTTCADVKNIHVPVATRFLITCIKAGASPYKLTWSSSLS